MFFRFFEFLPIHEGFNQASRHLDKLHHRHKIIATTQQDIPYMPFKISLPFDIHSREFFIYLDFIPKRNTAND